MSPDTALLVLAAAVSVTALATCCVLLAIARDIWRRKP
jgi:hypothetical protein